MTFLTDSIFESGAYGVPSESQNPTAKSRGPSSTQWSHPSSRFWSWCHSFDHNIYPPFWHHPIRRVLISPVICLPCRPSSRSCDQYLSLLGFVILLACWVGLQYHVIYLTVCKQITGLIKTLLPIRINIGHVIYLMVRKQITWLINTLLIGLCHVVGL